MSEEGVRIDALTGTINPSPEHEFPAMRNGQTVKLTVGQVLGLLAGDVPPELSTLEQLADALELKLDRNGANIGSNAAALRNALGLDYSDLKWLSKAVGEFYWADDNVSGVDIPPSGTGASTVWVELTAGLTGSGQFNENKLTSESVSGSAPLVQATAVVSLSGSPMNGQTIRLINTERRFLRAGSAGTAQDDALQAFRMELRNLQDNDWTTFGAVTTGGSGNRMAKVASSDGTRFQARGFVEESGFGTPRTGDETRGKNIGVRVFRRIK